MAIDTAARRRAALGVGLGPGTSLPLPDGTVDASDRAGLAGVYSSDNAPPPPPSSASARVYTDPPTVRSIDMKTLGRKFNEGAAKNPSYEFGAGRRKFYQPRDQENET